MRWKPSPEWRGQTAYIIGGGASLRGFDFSLLVDKNVIGCNYAYRLGPRLVPRVIFGDGKFWEQEKDALRRFIAEGGKVLTNNPACLKDEELLWMQRSASGCPKDGTLAWNYSTGAAAIHLSLLMGSRTTYLLGFDMRAEEGRTSWYRKRVPASGTTLMRHIRGMVRLNKDKEHHFPGQVVVNLTEGSDLTVFPTSSLNTHFQRDEC